VVGYRKLGNVISTGAQHLLLEVCSDSIQNQLFALLSTFGIAQSDVTVVADSDENQISRVMSKFELFATEAYKRCTGQKNEVVRIVSEYGKGIKLFGNRGQQLAHYDLSRNADNDMLLHPFGDLPAEDNVLAVIRFVTAGGKYGKGQWQVNFYS
jgi:hypothetical protein